MSNADLIKRARYFHADDLGGLVLPLTDALEAAEAALDQVASRVNAEAFDDSSSALESIGDTLEATGRKVWATS